MWSMTQRKNNHAQLVAVVVAGERAVADLRDPVLRCGDVPSSR